MALKNYEEAVRAVSNQLCQFLDSLPHDIEAGITPPLSKDVIRDLEDAEDYINCALGILTELVEDDELCKLEMKVFNNVGSV